MEDREILEEFIKYFEAEAISRKYRRNISITVGEDDIEAIKNILAENENLKQENKKLQESHDYIFDAYQDAGNKMFDYQEENENLKQSLIINKNLYEEVCNKNKELEEKIEEINNENRR